MANRKPGNRMASTGQYRRWLRVALVAVFAVVGADHLAAQPPGESSDDARERRNREAYERLLGRGSSLPLSDDGPLREDRSNPTLDGPRRPNSLDWMTPDRPGPRRFDDRERDDGGNRSDILGSAGRSFDWTTYRTSAIDLIFDERSRFRHHMPEFTADELKAYRRLIQEIVKRQQAHRRESAEGTKAKWESAFYRYAAVRAKAFAAGRLDLAEKTAGPDRDPFGDNLDDGRNLPAETPDGSRPQRTIDSYDIRVDMDTHPEQFVGRPIVMTGILRREGLKDLALDVRRTEAVDPEEESWRVTRGELIPLGAGKDAPWIAKVDTHGVELTRGATKTPRVTWPANRSEIPVLVKGWMVKAWDHRPLIYCETVREISEQPPTTLIREFAVSRQRVVPEEAWLYYETLSALELYAGNPALRATQRAAADAFLNQRLQTLRQEMGEQVLRDVAALKKDLEAGTITDATFRQKEVRLNRLVRQRLDRYRAARKDPRRFEAFVDLFTNPDVWQGQLVTLRGHVRYAVSYPGDPELFGGRMLHELWLFTDDSQQNPAVIVTPHLPEDFPVDAPLINQVSVTGCFFKHYVYRSQESRRIAPLILAGTIDWQPTDSEVLALADAGHLSAGSPLALRAGNQRPQGPGQSLLLLVFFGAFIVIMVLWGKSHRERQDRRNLIERIGGPPRFESLHDGRYSPGSSALSDYTSRYDV